jgi:hypothetical protein
VNLAKNKIPAITVLMLALMCGVSHSQDLGVLEQPDTFGYTPGKPAVIQTGLSPASPKAPGTISTPGTSSTTPNLLPQAQPFLSEAAMETLPDEIESTGSLLRDRCGCVDTCPPCNFIDVGVRVWNRTRPNEIVMISSEAVATTQGGAFILDPRMSNRELNLNVAPGLYITYDRYLGRDRQNRDDFLEFTYFGMNAWQDTHTVGGSSRIPFTGLESTGDLFSPFPSGVGGFNRADFQSIHYQSELHNFELALRLDPRGRADRLVAQPNGTWQHESQPGQFLSYLFGIRYLMLNESYLFHSDGEIRSVTSPVTSLGAVSGDYHVYSHNNLVGLDFGGDLTFRHNRYDWGVRGRLGPYVNYADQNSLVFNNASADLLNSVNVYINQGADHREVSLIGELGFYTDYQLRKNLVVHASWDFMWVTGLALAAEQLKFNLHPTASVVTNGSICFQGITLQLDSRW